jgi:hypothetical protein
MPTFWGARVPDQVLAEANYERVRAIYQQAPAAGAPPSIQALKHFMYRADWLRDVRGRDYYERLNNMVEDWWRLGMVLPVADPPPQVPADIRVEQGRHPVSPGADPKRELIAAMEALAHPDQQTAGQAASRLRALIPQAGRPPKRTFRQWEV